MSSTYYFVFQLYQVNSYLLKVYYYDEFQMYWSSALMAQKKRDH